MASRALSFGSVAAAYERYRLGYPDAVVDEVLAYAARPVRTALEVGAGTGKATRVFAAHGIDVTASEPDDGMLAELRRHVPSTVHTLEAGFEDLPLGATYDLVYAAAAFHWTAPEGRWERTAALLEPGGVFASFGGPVSLADADLQAQVDRARAPYLADDEVPSPDGTPDDSELQWPGTELTVSPHFTDVRQVRVERRIMVSAEDYLGHLGTVSAYLELAPATRSVALEVISRVLPPEVGLAADITLHLARRVP
jgi:SAM-dependent methyltransferase